jgi:hypothetical protein
MDSSVPSHRHPIVVPWPSILRPIPDLMLEEHNDVAHQEYFTASRLAGNSDQGLSRQGQQNASALESTGLLVRPMQRPTPTKYY